MQVTNLPLKKNVKYMSLQKTKILIQPEVFKKKSLVAFFTAVCCYFVVYSGSSAFAVKLLFSFSAAQFYLSYNK